MVEGAKSFEMDELTISLPLPSFFVPPSLRRSVLGLTREIGYWISGRRFWRVFETSRSCSMVSFDVLSPFASSSDLFCLLPSRRSSLLEGRFFADSERPLAYTFSYFSLQSPSQRRLWRARPVLLCSPEARGSAGPSLFLPFHPLPRRRRPMVSTD